MQNTSTVIIKIISIGPLANSMTMQNEITDLPDCDCVDDISKFVDVEHVRSTVLQRKTTDPLDF